MKSLLLTVVVIISVLLLLAAVFVSYFKFSRKVTWREAVSAAFSDILM